MTQSQIDPSSGLHAKAMGKCAQLMAKKGSGVCQTSQFISAMRHCSSVGIASSSAQ